MDAHLITTTITFRWHYVVTSTVLLSSKLTVRFQPTPAQYQSCSSPQAMVPPTGKTHRDLYQISASYPGPPRDHCPHNKPQAMPHATPGRGLGTAALLLDYSLVSVPQAGGRVMSIVQPQQ